MINIKQTFKLGGTNKIEVRWLTLNKPLSWVAPIKLKLDNNVKQTFKCTMSTKCIMYVVDNSLLGT